MNGLKHTAAISSGRPEERTLRTLVKYSQVRVLNTGRFCFKDTYQYQKTDMLIAQPLLAWMQGRTVKWQLRKRRLRACSQWTAAPSCALTHMHALLHGLFDLWAMEMRQYSHSSQLHSHSEPGAGQECIKWSTSVTLSLIGKWGKQTWYCRCLRSKSYSSSWAVRIQADPFTWSFSNSTRGLGCT